MSGKNKTGRIKYRAVIIGAGRIASGFDAPGDKKILTHAHALSAHRAVDLVGFFDSDKQANQQAAAKWSCRSFDSLAAIMAMSPDIVVVCVPGEYHYDILKQIIKFKPKLVICEKPLTVNLKDSEKIVKIYRAAGIPVLVNYFRRFDPMVRRVKKEIDEGKYGAVFCASGLYTRGLLNNGSHTLDIARFLFGEIKRCAPSYILDDFVKDDPSAAGFLEFEKCPQFHLMVSDGRAYRIREFTIFCEKAVLNFIKDGMRLTKRFVVADKIYAGYQVPGQEKAIKTGCERAMLELVNNAVEHLENGVPLLCSGQDALEDQRACVKLLKKIKK